jgi:hypothetical protein
MRDPFRAAAPAACALLTLWSMPVAADTGGESIYEITARAARDREIEPSHTFGKASTIVPASEVARDGGLLVGFEFGLGKLGQAEVIFAVRPVYRTPAREWSDSEYGAFSGRDSRVVRTRRVIARPGYAVGGLILSQGDYVTGASLIFMEVGPQALNPDSSYTSDWVGDRQGGAVDTYTGKGAPVIGVFAARRDNQLRALGLNYVRTPSEEVSPPPRVVTSGPVADEQAAASLAAQARAYREQQQSDHQTRWLWVGVFSAVALLSTIAGIIVRARQTEPDDEPRQPYRLPDT